MLVKELGRRVDVVICARVGPADDHNGVPFCGGGGGVVDAIVVDGGLEEVGIFFKPVVESVRTVVMMGISH